MIQKTKSYTTSDGTIHPTLVTTKATSRPVARKVNRKKGQTVVPGISTLGKSKGVTIMTAVGPKLL